MRRFLLIVMTVFIVALIGAYWLVFEADYSEGYRVGNVIKLSRKGVVFKTWEGTLQQGLITPGDQSPFASRLWDFSIANDQTDVRSAIDKSIEQNRRVKLYYGQHYFRVPIIGDTEYFINKVEILDDAALPQPSATPVPSPAAAATTPPPAPAAPSAPAAQPSTP